MRTTRTITTIALTLAILSQPALALAAGTGDDPRPTLDVQTANTTRVEREFQAWLSAQGPKLASAAVLDPVATEPTYFYFYTPTHYQEKSYYCGPASAQIIDDYWGTCATQATIAKYLGTTTAGTDFSKVDNAINAYAGQDYAYSGGCATDSDFVNRVTYGLSTRRHPMVADLNIHGGSMGNYVYDHPGHIVPLEAYDWRYGTVRLNDPYDEQSWRSGGGATGGHRTYSYLQVADALQAHWRQAVVY
ncbi:MAG: C39 family peptidase [Actinomycetota bacterium]|nr:MAG: FG-GAP repeat-containing [Actinomycetota bacterium]MDO8949516.1 C39 family peptidase [Actinomycetota bacterium]MDP3629473.1 C39 family peptidase [Actinomycetota bacterium]